MTDSVPINLIWVDRAKRQRRNLDPDSSLQSSIARVGLINPIVVRRDFELVAGERRLEACKALNWESIPVRWLEELSSSEAQLIELEENLKRSDLSWQDTCRAVAQIHQLYRFRDPKWNQARTSEALSMNEGWVSDNLMVAGQLDDPKISKASSIFIAKNRIRRRNTRAAAIELNELAEFIMSKEEDNVNGISIRTISEYRPGEAGGPVLDSTPRVQAQVYWSKESVATSILQEDFLKWASNYSGPTFNLIHFDPPYGKNVFSGADQFKDEDYGEGEGAYKDQEDIFWKLTSCLLDNLPRLLGPSGHLVFWMDSSPCIQQNVIELFEKRLAWYPHPLIWHKTDNSGIVGDSQRWPRHTHEAALLGIRGRRPLVQTFGDSYAGPGDRKIHPSCKPEPMLRHFFGGLVDEHTRFFDPTCGSGSAIRAAESLGASETLGLEISPRFCESAREALQHFRMNRRGSQIVKGKRE